MWSWITYEKYWHWAWVALTWIDYWLSLVCAGEPLSINVGDDFTSKNMDRVWKWTRSTLWLGRMFEHGIWLNWLCKSRHERRSFIVDLVGQLSSWLGQLFEKRLRQQINDRVTLDCKLGLEPPRIGFLNPSQLELRKASWVFPWELELFILVTTE